MNRSHALLSLSLLASSIGLACSDDQPNDDEVGTMGDGDGDGSTDEADTSDATEEAEGTTTTSESSTDDATSESSTDDATESTTDTTEDTTDSTTGDENVTYSAVSFPGGLDRVIITRVDMDAPSCSQMVLVLPGFDNIYDISVPPMWDIEQIRSWDQLECDLMVTPDSLGEGGTGMIEFLGLDAFDIYPCALSFDAEIDMDTDPPSSMIWFTDFLMVDGVNCG